MDSTTTKEELYHFCSAFVNNRLSRIQKQISGLQEALASETKSSAGDKHETGRAMIQLEREKLGQQLAEAEKMKKVVSQIQMGHAQRAGLGSLVQTDKNAYYLCISAGEFKNDDSTKIYCVSMGSPIGKLLLGKSSGDSFIFNKETITVVKIQ